MRGAQQAVLVASILAMVILSGCVDESVGPEEPVIADDDLRLVDPDTGDTAPARAVPMVFDEGAPDHVMDSFEGTFSFDQHGYPLGNVQREAGMDPGNIHNFDLTDKVPKGVPVRLVAEVDADLPRGDLDLWFNVPPTEIWTSDFDTPYGGWSKVTFVILHTSDDPISVSVRYDEYDQSASFDYVLDVGIWTAPSFLPAGIPVSIPVPRGPSSIELEFQDEPAERVWLWGPDDKAIETAPPMDGRWNHTFTVPGDHVLMLPDGPSEANVSLVVLHDGKEAVVPYRFGLLEQVFEQTDPDRFEANTPASHGFEVSRAPLQVGVMVVLDRFSKDLSLGLEGPNGPLMSVTLEDDMPFYTTTADGGIVFNFLTRIGDPDLAAGEYTATFSGDPNGPGELSAWIVHYAR